MDLLLASAEVNERKQRCDEKSEEIERNAEKNQTNHPIAQIHESSF